MTNDILIGALINQLNNGHPLPALRAFKALAESLPGIRQPEVITAINRACKHDDEAIREEARAARLLMWRPAKDESVRVDGFPGRVRMLIAGGEKATVEYDDGDTMFVDDFDLWEIAPRTKTR